MSRATLDERALLEKNAGVLGDRPLAVFALGPIEADDGLAASRDDRDWDAIRSWARELSARA